MKKLMLIVMLISVLMFFVACSNEEPPVLESESNLSASEVEPISDGKSHSEIISGEFTEELLSWIHFCFPEEKAKQITEHPNENTSTRSSGELLGGKYIFTEVQFYHQNEVDPVNFSFVENQSGERKILPEKMNWRLAHGIIGKKLIYFQHKGEIAFYEINNNFDISKTLWKPEGCIEVGAVFHIKGKNALAVFWQKQGEENFTVSLLDENGKEIYTANTGIKLVFDENGLSYIGLISESYSDFGVLRFLIHTDNSHPYDLEIDTGKITDLEGVFGGDEPPTEMESPFLDIFENESGKFGLKNGDETIVPAKYDSITLCRPNRYYGEPPFSHFYEAYLIDGTTEKLEFKGENQIPTITTGERRIYTLFYPNGTQMNDILFEDYEVSDGMNGYYDKTAYYYEYDGEKFVCSHKIETEKTDTGFGYYITSRPWGPSGIMYYGISDKNGKVILEPVYSKLEMPFAERICRYNGGSARQGWEFSQCEITDIDGKIICDKYNAVFFTVFDDGSYIGWAIAGNSEIKTFDENGKEMPDGYWFIDKNGKIISETFAEFSGFTGEKLDKDMEFQVILPDGTERTINTNDYILKE